MFNFIKNFFILMSMIFIFQQELFCIQDYEPKDDKRTFTQWSNRCFKELVESSKGGTLVDFSTVQHDELVDIFKAFIQSWRPIFEKDDLWKGNKFEQDKLDDLFNEPANSVFFNFPLPVSDQPESTHVEKKVIPFVQKKIIPDDSQVCFIGDLHGSVHSLLRNLWRLVNIGWLDDNFKLTQKNRFIVFNGDFVDRGAYGVECIYTLLRLKMANWDNVFLLRGNHEDIGTMGRYSFLKEMEAKYKVKTFFKVVFFNITESIIMLLQRFNELLPFALYLGAGKDAANGNKPNFVQCCHGGIETGFDPKPLLADPSDMMFEVIPSEVSKSYKCCPSEMQKMNNYDGFNWSDFEQIDDPALIFNSGRGVGYLTGPQGANVFLKDNGIKAFFRGHQDRSFGFKMLFESCAALNSKKTSSKVYFNAGDYYSGPFWWKYVVGEKIDNFKINGFSPIFTFTTAAEGQGVPYDCFGILNVAEKYEDWVLTPHEYPLDGHSQSVFNRKGKSFTRIDLDAATKGCLVHFFEDNKKGNAGVQELLAKKAYDNIATKKPAPHVESVLVKSLSTLQTSLTLLKTKLKLLNDAMKKLKVAL